MIKREERNLALAVETCLVTTSIGGEIENDTCLTTLGSALTYLAIAQLQLNPLWLHKTRWLDGIEWSSLLLSAPDAIQGKGTIWWGQRSEPAASLVGTEFDATLKLSALRSHPRVSYVMGFEIEGVPYFING